MKKLVCLVISLIFVCFAFSGCKNQKPSKTKTGKPDPTASAVESPEPIASAAEKPDPTAVVASIGEEKITYARYATAFESYLAYMQQFGYNPVSDEASLLLLQDKVMDVLVSNMITLYRAKKDNFTLSEAAAADAEKQVETEMEQIRDKFMSYAEKDYEKDDSKSREEYFNDYVSSMSEYYTGTKMNFDEYSEFYKTEMRNSALIDAYKKYVCADFTVPESAIEDWYRERLTANEELYNEHPEEYKQNEEYFEMSFGIEEEAYPQLFIPEGYSRIMDIAIYPEGELGDEYNEKSEHKQELYDECTLLMFNDALNGTNENAERIAELLDEYRQVTAECESMYDEYTADAKKKADAAYAALENGRPFAEVMLEYTEDPLIIGEEDHDGCETFKTKGRLISVTHHSETGDWSRTVKDIFGTLKAGEYSAVFPDEDGNFHIIYHVSDEKAGKVALDVFHDAIRLIVKEKSDETAWQELMESWKDDPEFKMDMALVRMPGSENLPAEKPEDDKNA